jgi:hypothetical protein
MGRFEFYLIWGRWVCIECDIALREQSSCRRTRVESQRLVRRLLSGLHVADNAVDSG